MSLAVFLAVLGAAVMHAAWNALLKVRLDRFSSISLMSLGMGLFALPLLLIVEVPTGITWFWIGLSMVMHAGYRLFLVKAYEAGDLAQSYPLARGAAPLLTALGGVFLLQEVPAAAVIVGIVVLSAGTFLMSARGGSLAKGSGRAVGYALVTSIFIAGYTLSDGTGARSAPTATSYAAWLFVIDTVSVMALWFAARGGKVLHVMREEWRISLVAGFLSAFAYWIAMWAMTKAPIAAVAALRESSILFAMLISVLFLGEKLTRWRVLAALCILIGILAIRLG